MSTDIHTYISKLQNFLNNDSIIEYEDIEINQRFDLSNNLIGMELKQNSRIKFRQGYELIVNYEFGLINNNNYIVKEYNYHYNDPKKYFRFESKPEPHINDYKDGHWFYEIENVYSKKRNIETKKTNLNTKNLNLYIMLHICKNYIQSEKYPIHPKNCAYYNEIIKNIRRDLK